MNNLTFDGMRRMIAASKAGDNMLVALYAGDEVTIRLSEEIPMVDVLTGHGFEVWLHAIAHHNGAFTHEPMAVLL